MNIEEAKKRILKAENEITNIINTLEKETNLIFIKIDDSIRTMDEKGCRLPYVRIKMEI